MRDSNLKTTKCFVCLKPVTVEHGHFILGDMMVLAGTCSEHCNTISPRFFNRMGCYGAWCPEYGLAYDPH